MEEVLNQNFSSAQLLSIAEVTKLLPRINGRRLHVSTVWRWCRKGIKGIRLDHNRLGCAIFISQDALNSFFAELAQADDSLMPKPIIKQVRKMSGSAREKSLAQADAILRKAGIKRS